LTLDITLATHFFIVKIRTRGWSYYSALLPTTDGIVTSILVLREADVNHAQIALLQPKIIHPLESHVTSQLPAVGAATIVYCMRVPQHRPVSSHILTPVIQWVFLALVTCTPGDPNHGIPSVTPSVPTKNHGPHWGSPITTCSRVSLQPLTFLSMLLSE